MSMNPELLLLAFLFPLTLAIGLMTGLFRRVALLLAPIAALPALIISLTYTPDVVLKLPWLLFGTYVGFDETTQVFLLFTSLLWLIAGIYSVGYFSDPIVRARFFVWFLLAMTGNIGLVLAQDLPFFYTFFALMSFASYGLVAHERSPDALRAGRIYIILVVIGEILLFIGFALASQAGSSIEFQTVRSAIAASEIQNWIIALTFLGFGIKVGVIGLHLWLPLAHPVAPTPASAVLSGAMIAAGLLGWLRIFPLGEATLNLWGELLIIAGMTSVYYAVIIGVLQKKAKTVLAYSSISKMGIMTMGVGLGFLAPESWPVVLTAILVFALHHGLVKGGLFLGVGLATLPTINKAQRLLLIAGLILLALSLAAGPWTSGMLAKEFFKTPLELALSPQLAWISTLFTLSAVATTLLMIRFLYVVWPKKTTIAETTIKNTEQHTSAMWWSWSVLLAVVIISPLLIPLLPVFASKADWSTYALVAAFLPVLTGVIIAASIWFTPPQLRQRFTFNVPAGDILMIVEKGLYPLLLLLVTSTMTGISKAHASFQSSWENFSHGRIVDGMLESAEKKLRRWTVTLTLLLFAGGVSVLLIIR